MISPAKGHSVLPMSLDRRSFPMKRFAAFSPLILLVTSMVIAQDNAAAEGTAGEQADVQASPLDQLDWLIGRWVDESEDSRIITNCSWTMNRKFLTRSFSIMMDDEVTLEGTQFVGWDPIAEEIRSWTFDSEGGIGEGRWIRDGNRWLVKTTFVLASGERASAINVLTYVDQNTLKWQSTNREIGGELQPNIPEVTVVRQSSEDSEKEESR
jgi:hypothetical protein